MAFGSQQHMGQTTGRREHSRLHVRLPARLITVSATRSVILADLSLFGASLRDTGPLGVGKEAVLQWAGFEAFGRVVWSHDDCCGLHFTEMVAPRELIATRDLHDSLRLQSDRDLTREVAREWVDGTRRL